MLVIIYSYDNVHLCSQTSSNPGAPSSINFTTEGPLTLRRAVEQCSCHNHPRDSSGSKAPKPPSNVNPGLINPKRLFDWGGTI